MSHTVTMTIPLTTVACLAAYRFLMKHQQVAHLKSKNRLSPAPSTDPQPIPSTNPQPVNRWTADSTAKLQKL
ncbi:hypothetical protein Hanom_Chr07g00590711 [Helianthus anomalus]